VPDERTKPDIARLVDDHLDAVYRYAYWLTGSRADAEDLSQEAFLIAQQNLGKMRDPDRARSWLFTILRNCFFKSRQRLRPLPAASLQMNVDAIPDTAAIDPELIDSEELQRALDELPEMFRLVLVMFYYEELSYREIAEALELPIGTVMSRLARAKAHLRTRLFPSEHPSSRRKRPTATPRG
jgi:RNA polymerase sigma-70 factor, ECF subfamily